MKKAVRWIVGVSVLLFCTYGHAAVRGIHDNWDSLLQVHVKNGLVDYNGFKRQEKLLDEYLHQLAEVPTEQLSGNEKLAFYINAYNAYTIKLILQNFRKGSPPRSIKDIGGFFSSPWSIRFAVVGGDTLTLDNIEHDIIRKEFDEPRVHFAVNCASLSCPPLLNRAYRGELLDDQLQENTRRFLNDPHFTRLEGTTLFVSKIFKWFGEDFKDDIPGFVRTHAGEELQHGLQAGGDRLIIKYLDYDWSLNSQ
ncbi:DUF547 domain-containing protein [Desulfopila sp. IMCC35008]|uniref:DUF547 domain-containing protein n=1 Tax=Desulfopila sp. IMCC35008 TaxID=2653858 RepID=UPI0013D362A1|nr:DUF547 domain-containing protein [Desulfopila sp. IMCC35008]